MEMQHDIGYALEGLVADANFPSLYEDRPDGLDIDHLFEVNRMDAPPFLDHHPQSIQSCNMGCSLQPNVQSDAPLQPESTHLHGCVNKPACTPIELARQVESIDQTAQSLKSEINISRAKEQRLKILHGLIKKKRDCTKKYIQDMVERLEKVTAIQSDLTRAQNNFDGQQIASAGMLM